MDVDCDGNSEAEAAWLDERLGEAACEPLVLSEALDDGDTEAEAESVGNCEALARGEVTCVRLGLGDARCERLGLGACNWLGVVVRGDDDAVWVRAWLADLNWVADCDRVLVAEPESVAACDCVTVGVRPVVTDWLGEALGLGEAACDRRE